MQKYKFNILIKVSIGLFQLVLNCSIRKVPSISSFQNPDSQKNIKSDLSNVSYRSSNTNFSTTINFISSIKVPIGSLPFVEEYSVRKPILLIFPS